MHLSSLSVQNFRNLADQRLELPPEGLALVGDNGQGKTNLLEAIYYLEIFRSFRGAADEQLVRFSEEFFRVEADAQTPSGVQRVAAAFERRSRRKKVTINGSEPERLGDALGAVGAVIFSPSDVEIVAGSPSERRRFLDIVLSLSAPGYLHALQKYRQILAQRNTLLRRGSASLMVSAWDGGLATWGSRVIAARAGWVKERADAFARHVHAIADGGDASLQYDGSIPAYDDADLPLQPERLIGPFHDELERARERESRRGMTLVGPHRDDLRIRAVDPGHGAWIDLRSFGSGGQQRTAAIAMRMIEAETLRESAGYEPIILLDDVFAELDPGRSRRILEWVENEEGGQVILTAPKPTDIEIRGGALQRWSVRDGVISTL